MASLGEGAAGDNRLRGKVSDVSFLGSIVRIRVALSDDGPTVIFDEFNEPTLTLPQLGETVTEGTVGSWRKQVGDSVEFDDPLFEVSTDKVDSEIPSPYDGVILEILVPEGETVPVGSVLARVGEGGAAPAPAPAPAAAPAPQVPKPVTRPKVTPALTEPKTEPLPTPPLPKVDLKLEQPALPTDLALSPGTGGGTGNDGTSGNGPGTGGGVGTGRGTGRGSGSGPGTGGGEGTIYPATPDFLLMPSLPVPKHIQGRTLVLRFSIDERGQILKVEFESSGDGGYDKQLRQRFSEYRFRPAHKWDGTPVPSIYVAQLTL
jgi:hypothetical protein